MLRQLIVNADDFGLSTGVNKAVEQAWLSGILTQASLMPGGAAFDEAVEIAHRNPGLQVGLHLTLVQGKPVLPPAQIKGLVRPDGCFPDNPVAVGLRLYFDRGIRDQLKSEIEAQIKKIQATGIPLTHIDGHLNIQMHPTVFELLTELMPQYGITSFRTTRERLRHNLYFDPTRLVGKSIERCIFGVLAGHAEPALSELGVHTAMEVKGLLNSGRMTEEYLLSILDGLQEGVSEIYFHPGRLPDAEISSRMPEYLHEQEFAALVSPRVRQRLIELNISLYNYRGDEKTHV